jgi:predicted amidophosphoribosyltransferase
MKTDPHICPTCGERVSAFAAGCALCGSALDPRRAQGSPNVSRQVRSAWRNRPRLLPRLPSGRLARTPSRSG